MHGEIFESGKKKLRIQKYPYTCEQGLDVKQSANVQTYNIFGAMLGNRVRRDASVPTEVLTETGNHAWKVSGAESRESQTVFDSGYNDMDSGSQVLDSNLCQWKLILDPIESGIPDSKAQDSGFH